MAPGDFTEPMLAAAGDDPDVPPGVAPAERCAARTTAPRVLRGTAKVLFVVTAVIALAALKLPSRAGSGVMGSAEALQLSGDVGDASPTCKDPSWIGEIVDGFIPLFIIQPVGTMIRKDISFFEAQINFDFCAAPIWIAVLVMVLGEAMTDGLWGYGCASWQMTAAVEIILGMALVAPISKMTRVKPS